MASKSIVAKGTTYNGVESVTFPVSGGGNATFYEVSDTTAGASDVASGKYFYTSSGVKTEGTASGGSATLITKNITANGTYNASSDNADGYSSVTVSVSGGGGLVYETGTWTPSEDVATYVISFANTHTEPPFFYIVSDATGSYSNATNTGYATWFVDWHHLFGEAIYETASSLKYSEYRSRYKGSSDSISGGGAMLNYPYTDSGDSSATYPRYFATETGIRAYASSTARYWRAGRTYKWIAVWKPTT